MFPHTSYLQLFSRGGLAAALILLFAKKFSEPLRCRRSAISDRGYRFGSNEVETGKYSGSWLPRLDRGASSFPPSPSRNGTQAFCLCGERTCCPRIQQVENLLTAQTGKSVFRSQRLALGNCIQSQQRNCSRISREFLAPLHDRN